MAKKKTSIRNSYRHKRKTINFVYNTYSKDWRKETLNVLKNYKLT